eukprot:15366382-Ditylum_brightwellii.AAC.1
MQEYKEGPFKEHALLIESFTHYIDQMIESNNDISVLLTVDKDLDIVLTEEESNVKTEPKDVNNVHTMETWYYHKIEMIIDDKMNTMELMKIESIKLKDKE